MKLQEKNKQNSTSELLKAMAVYSFIAVFVLIVNIITGTIPPTLMYSVSVNVGCHVWSSVLYLFGNIFNCSCLIKFFRRPELPKLYRIFGYFVAAQLIIVSLCPIELINSTFDYVHNILARVILISLIVHTFIGAICFRKNPKCLMPHLICLAIDVFMVLAVLFFPPLFWKCLFLSEFTLIGAYFASMIFVSKNI